ncbi:MAG: hypothetical protein HRU09_13260 [Oligoflexales bacterium]|nr:hypothetical protein [Oligoflexales bacterium]
MYVTNTSSCASDGEWEPYSLNREWKLSTPNTESSVYVKFRNNSGDISECISSSITHDDTPPTDIAIDIEGGISAVSSTNVS